MWGGELHLTPHQDHPGTCGEAAKLSLKSGGSRLPDNWGRLFWNQHPSPLSCIRGASWGTLWNGKVEELPYITLLTGFTEAPPHQEHTADDLRSSQQAGRAGVPTAIHQEKEQFANRPSLKFNWIC